LFQKRRRMKVVGPGYSGDWDGSNPSNSTVGAEESGSAEGLPAPSPPLVPMASVRNESGALNSEVGNADSAVSDGDSGGLTSFLSLHPKVNVSSAVRQMPRKKAEPREFPRKAGVTFAMGGSPGSGVAVCSRDIRRKDACKSQFFSDVIQRIAVQMTEAQLHRRIGDDNRIGEQSGLQHSIGIR
jgi:hypothetical protein